MMNRSLRRYRQLAISLGLAVLGWQFINLSLGRFWHEYIVADVIASLVLIGTAARASGPGMLVGFAMFVGIFLAASTGKLIVGGSHPGTIAAAMGIVPGLVGAIGLARRMIEDPGG